MMTAPSEKDILRLINKCPMTTRELGSLFDREDRENIGGMIDDLVVKGYIERLPGTIFDGPSYRITEKGAHLI